MTRIYFTALAVLAVTALIGACPGVDGNVDAGPDVEPEPQECSSDPDVQCTCETEEDEWPGPLNLDGLALFAESGCTKLRGALNLTPQMLQRVAELEDIESAAGLNIFGDYPSGTNLEELSFLQSLRLVSVQGATGITSLSGLENITNLEIGLHIEDAPDIVTIGMGNLRSIGITEPGSRVVQDAAMLLVDLPALETLSLPVDYKLEAAPLILKRLPRLDAGEARDLIAQFSAMSDEQRNPSPGVSPDNIICELPEEVGNGAHFDCPDQ